MRLTDDVRTLMRPNDPAPPAAEELSEQARFTLEDILVSRPGAVSTRTGVGPTPRRILSGRSRKRRRWLIPMSIAVATSTGVAVALVYPQPQRASVTDEISCYADTDLRADPFHGSKAFMAGEGVDSSAVALELCGDLWRRGVLRWGQVAGPDHTEENLPVPNLVACVRKGSAAVFPSDDPEFCRAAGLAPLLRPDR